MDSEDCSIETEAENLYLKGVELERNFRHYDAIRYYRKALQLVPDIDVRMYKSNKLRDFKNQENIENRDNASSRTDDCDSDEDDYDGSEPLLERIQRILDKSDRFIIASRSQKGLHISDLPQEIIMYILRWVVSDELDLRSLDQCALICRGFYLYARDPHIWKSACQRVWKNEKLNLTNHESWRDMFIHRLRISTNGCYIAETKYYRQGERSFQDQNYRPYHLVVYYRYLRFFADGKVLMINTPDTPNIIVGQLKNKNSKLGAMFCGSYEMVGDLVYTVFKLQKIRKRNPKNSAKDQYIDLTYNMTFQIKRYKKYKTKLIWKQYTLKCADEVSFEENFEIQDHVFPPLWFSRVKSYTVESENPLA
ncbi:F-box only protein 9 [Planococcus citri]|uniref:F-box only protein 9 n=1 Tax=Planococcus citri TaxID=170843 RepID=UPI0031F8B9B3